jgi:glycosyltransferase A (GT-A) superfamily protein (DUF2064 family)
MSPGVQILVLAKAPVPGRVKTRLCPPCTPQQAAQLAGAALADTLDTVSATPAAARTLVLDGTRPAPPGWSSIAQRGTTLGERIRHGFVDSRLPLTPSLLIGMDTPQVSRAHLRGATARLCDTTPGPDRVDAVLGLAADGGWWALGLREPEHAGAVRDVQTSTADTGALTLAALRSYGLRVAMLPVLRDVDTAPDAHAVAALCPTLSHFAAAVRLLLPSPVPR